LRKYGIYAEEDYTDTTPLHIAAKYNYIDIVKYLVIFQKYNKVNAQNNHGYTPLHCACSRGNLDVMEFLI
jgi:ankyrin repeat protein